MMRRKMAKRTDRADVEVEHCWSPGCFWVTPRSAAAQEWLRSHTPLSPAWIRPAVLLEPEDWRDGAFMVANPMAMHMIVAQMKTARLRVAASRLPPEVKAWRKQAGEIAANVRLGTLGWSFSDVDPNDARPRNAFGYLLGFGEAKRRYYATRPD